MRSHIARAGLGVLSVLFSTAGLSAGDLTVLFPAGFDSSPASFMTTDGYTFPVNSQAFSSSFQRPSDDQLVVGAAPPNDQTYSIPIDAGYRAAFGSPRNYTVHGDSTNLTLPLNESRVDPSGLYLRVVGNPYSYEFGFPFLHNFDVKFVGTGGTTSIYSVPFNSGMGTATVYNDVSLGGGSSLTRGSILGNFTLDASMGMSESAGHYRLDTAVAIAVKNPLLRSTAGTEYKQTATPWGPHRYAPNEYDALIASDQAAGATGNAQAAQEALDLTATKNNYTLAAKGCAVSSYAMGLATLGISGGNPESLMSTLESAGAITVPTRVTGWKRDAQGNKVRPYLNGCDVDPLALEQIFSGQGLALKAASTPGAIAKYLAQGDPVVMAVHNGGHYVLARGMGTNASGAYTVTTWDPGHPDQTGADFSSIQFSHGWALTLASEAASSAAARAPGNPSSEMSAAAQAPQSARSDAIIELNGPVTLAVTDPAGHQVALNTTSGETSNSLSGSTVYRTLPILDPEDSAYSSADLAALSNVDLQTVVAIPSQQLLSGNYRFSVVGASGGTYDLKFGWDGGQGFQNYQSSGAISPGQELNFTVPVTVVPEPTWGTLAAVALMATLSRRKPKSREV